jgi:hypothetical protein
MKNLSRLLVAPVLVAVLLLACTPTNAAHRGGGSAYDGTWSVAIYTLRGDCGSVRVAARIVGGRVYSNDQSYHAQVEFVDLCLRYEIPEASSEVWAAICAFLPRAHPGSEECRAGELSGKRASTCAPATGTISDVCATPTDQYPNVLAA